MSIRGRVAILVVMLVTARQSVVGRQPVHVPLAKPLAYFPRTLDMWEGSDAGALDPEIVRVLGADDYLNRVYANRSGGFAGLYVAYYGSQRQGDAIHSPLHCLPGNGWTPVTHTRRRLDVGAAPISINHYIVEKAGIQNLVVYWFQGRGRVVASEYANKAYLLADAFRLRRTDEALVRIVTPIDGNATDEVAMHFARVLYPVLTRWLP